jgi:hypothetical protein
MIFHLWNNQFNPLHYSSLPFPFTPYYSVAFSAFHCAILLHRCNVFQYCSFSIILFSSPSSPYCPQTVPLLETCVYLSIYLSDHIFWIYHIWEKTCDLCLLEPGFLCLTWWSPIPFITCKWHNFILYHWIIFHMYIYHVNPFMSCRTSGCFHSLAIVNSAVINMGCASIFIVSP